jgi:arsenite methyltransferase
MSTNLKDPAGRTVSCCEPCCGDVEAVVPVPATGEELAATVRERYGAAARRVLGSVAAGAPARSSASGGVNGCCGASPCGEAADPITSDLYLQGETDELPEGAVLASLGCGNPTALAELRAGEVVLDLGSGGGIDVLLSARRVGPSGRAYGLDMTDDMLALARRNAAEAGVSNVEFLRGRIEEIPLPSSSVDVIISNCVVNLSGDKRAVLREAFRVLKPGGRLAVSDVVVRGELPADVKRSVELWIGCVAGALSEGEFLELLGEAGFEDASVEFTRTYTAADAGAFLASSGLDAARIAREVDGRVGAAFVRATKPGNAVPAAAAGDATLRAAVPADLEAVERLLTASALPLDGVAGALDTFVVAEAGGRIVGVAGVEPRGADAVLRSVAVDASWRGRGLGRALVARVLELARDGGVGGLYLLTTTAEGYFPAFGFRGIARGEVPEAVARSVEFASACPASATVMRLGLRPGSGG